MQPFIHYFLHLGFPAIIAWFCFRDDWKKAYLLLLTTMIVDADHLMADPIFEANRCSIQFHILHTYYAAVVYVIILFFSKPIRILGIGLLFHLFTDLVDCMMMYARCSECLAVAPALELLEVISALIGL